MILSVIYYQYLNLIHFYSMNYLRENMVFNQFFMKFHLEIIIDVILLG